MPIENSPAQRAGPSCGCEGLFAAFNIAGGTVTAEFHRQHRAVELEKFLVATPADRRQAGLRG
jgi:hypothetical protein